MFLLIQKVIKAALDLGRNRAMHDSGGGVQPRSPPRNAVTNDNGDGMSLSIPCSATTGVLRRPAERGNLIGV